MSKNNAELAHQITERGGRMSPAAFEQTMGKWFGENKRKLATLAGSLEVAQKILVALIQSTSKTPKLMECAPETLFACVASSCATQLFPGPLQECAFVPFYSSRNKRLEATWMPMYGGLLKLAFNAGHLRAAHTEVVYEADEFDFSLGSDPFIKHRPFLGSPKDRGERTCVYSCLETQHGRMIVVKSIDFVEGIRARAPGAKMSDSPWNGSEDDYDAMARKTVLKQGLKFIPKSAQLAQAIAQDGTERSESALPSSVLDLSTMGLGAAPAAGTRSAEAAVATNTQPALEHDEQAYYVEMPDFQAAAEVATSQPKEQISRALRD